jgi:hypothetical protein
MYSEFTDLKMRTIELMLRILSAAQANDLELSEMVDLGFLCRELATAADEIEKDATARQRLLGKVVCFRVLQDSDLANPVLDVKGTLASGTVNYKMMVIPPSKGTPEYLDLLKYLGVSDDALATGAVKLDWKGLQEHLNGLLESGNPVPPTLSRQVPDHTLTYRRSRNGKA